MKSVSIILLNYNSSNETIECIQSLDKISTEEITVSLIVVDNNSEKIQVEKLESFLTKYKGGSALRIEYISNKKNLGYTGGNNSGIKLALETGSDFIMVLNNDTVVKPDFLKPLIEQLERDSTVGVVVPKIYFAPGHEFHTKKYSDSDKGKVIWYAGGQIDWSNAIGHHRGVDEVDDNKMYSQVVETEYATGACMMLKSSTIKVQGMFDEKFFLYYEDSDLSMRIKNSGLKILFVPQSVIWHKNAGSTGGSGSNLQDYFISRNRMLFGMRYAPIRTKMALVRESFRILMTGRKWQKRGIKDFYLRKFGKGTYPLSK